MAARYQDRSARRDRTYWLSAAPTCRCGVRQRLPGQLRCLRRDHDERAAPRQSQQLGDVPDRRFLEHAPFEQGGDESSDGAGVTVFAGRAVSYRWRYRGQRR